MTRCITQPAIRQPCCVLGPSLLILLSRSLTSALKYDGSTGCIVAGLVLKQVVIKVVPGWFSTHIVLLDLASLNCKVSYSPFLSKGITPVLSFASFSASLFSSAASFLSFWIFLPLVLSFTVLMYFGFL